MKDYNEMANAVFRRRDEFLAARKKKQALILKAGIPVCSLLLVTLVGVAIWQGGRLPSIPTATEPVETSVSVNAATANTNEDTENTTDNIVIPDEGTEAMTDPAENAAIQNSNNNNQGSNNSQGGSNSNSQGNSGSSSQGSSNGNTGSITPDTTQSATDPPEVKPTGPSTDANGVVVPPTDSIDKGDVPEVTEPMVRPTLPMEEATTAGSLEDPWQGDSSYPATSPWLPEYTEPTEPPTGPATITCGGKTYEAYTGDKVTVNVQLYVDKPVHIAQVLLKYSKSGLEVVTLKDYGFTDNQLRNAHFPNSESGYSTVNYRHIYNSYRYDYNAVRASVNEIDDTIEIYGYKTFVTFDFIVTRPGKLFIEPIVTDVMVEGEIWYCESGKVYNASGYAVSCDAVITPAELVTEPIPPADEVVEEEPFTYPKESFDGDLVINCDGRTYSADVGDTITYIVELEADEMFEGAQVIFGYNEEKLNVIKPEKAKETLPELHGYAINYSADNGEVKTDKCVKFSASDIYGFDFRRRKVFMKIDFEVIFPGEIELGLIIEEMTKLGGEESFFAGSQQVCFEGIDIYEYVIVNKK